MDAPDYKVIFDRAYVRALRFLSFRPRSEKEITDYLTKKKFESIIIESVIELLKEQKFLNDQEFTQWWIEQRQVNRPKGKIIIKHELQQKGISPEIIENELEESQDDFKTAKSLFEKKQIMFTKYTGEQYKQKVASYFQRRGFGWDIIIKILKEHDY